MQQTTGITLVLSLATIMLEQLAGARRVIEDGHEMVPAWRIATGEGNFVIFTRFDNDKDEQRGRAQFVPASCLKKAVARDANFSPGVGVLFCVGLRRVSRHERLAVLQRIQRGDSANPCGSHRITSTISSSPCCRRVLRNSLPRKLTSSRVFGKNGELRAERSS